MNLQTGLNQGILFETPTEKFIELCGKWEIRNVELRVPKLREWVGQMCEAVECPLVIDYYNLFQGGMIPDDFPMLKSPVHIIHLNDAEMLPPEKLDVMYTRTFPGDGKLDAAAWTLAALKAGYTGVFSLELFLRELWHMEPDAAMFKIAGKLKQFTESLDKLLKPIF